MEKIIYQPPKGVVVNRKMIKIAFATYKQLALQFWKWLTQVFNNDTHRS